LVDIFYFPLGDSDAGDHVNFFRGVQRPFVFSSNSVRIVRLSLCIAFLENVPDRPFALARLLAFFLWWNLVEFACFLTSLASRFWQHANFFCAWLVNLVRASPTVLSAPHFFFPSRQLACYQLLWFSPAVRGCTDYP